MDGMEAMVKMRGGIYNLGMNGALNEIVCWYLSSSLELQSTNSQPLLGKIALQQS
jgi:hypothetical protein